MMLEITVRLGFAGGLRGCAWGLTENVSWERSVGFLEEAWGSGGYTMSSPSISKEVTLP